jgi:tRNA(Ile)-lysidine synthase
MTGGTDAFFRTEPDLFHSFPALDLTGRSALAAAVSGGSDSVALLLLTKAWLEARAPGMQLVAVTVDHGLRPESSAEARDVAALCARYGIAHRIVRWVGDKPASGLSAAARDARYRLLAEAARSFEADIVLTGHTLDDQIETVAMRSARGEGRGLAGVAPATLFEGRIWVVRPLLGVRREALRRLLRQNEISWADDPTNVNIKYERPRVRARLAAGGKQDAFLAGIELAQHRRVDLGKRAATIFREKVELAAPGLIRLARNFFDGDAEAAIYALRILLAACGGSPHLPDEARSAELFGRLKGGTLRATLSRSAVDVRKSGVYLRREWRGLPPATPVFDGMVWDGRFRLRCACLSGELTVAPFGTETARAVTLPAIDAPRSLIRAAFAAEPALWAGTDWLGSATAAQGRAAGVLAVPVIAPWAQFLPSFDLAAARALSELLGCEPVPGLPFGGHNER